MDIDFCMAKAGACIRCASVYLVMSAYPVYAADISIAEIDKRDVDILVGKFSNLVTAFETFAINENSILEQRIDQVFDRFDEAMECAVDKTIIQTGNHFGREWPWWLGLFMSDVDKYCNTQVLRKNGGTLEYARFEQCRVQSEIVRQSVPIEALSASYAGLKGIVHAPYCEAADRKGTAEYEQAKTLFSHASIMTQVYNDIAKIDGCELGTAERLYQCSKRYHAGMVVKLQQFFHVDQSHINYQALAEARDTLPPPATKRSWLFFDEAYLTLDHLQQYEALTADLYRAYSVAELNRVKRIAEYRQKVSEPSAQIAELKKILGQGSEVVRRHYTNCDVTEGKFHSDLHPQVVSKIEQTGAACKAAIGSNKYADLVKDSEKTLCITDVPIAVETAEKLVADLESECSRAIYENAVRWERRTQQLNAF